MDKELTFAVNLGIVECVHVSILNDVCVEDTETLSVSLSSELSYVSVDASASSVSITINDDDGKIIFSYVHYNLLIMSIPSFEGVQVNFQQMEYTVDEGSGNIEICVEHKECLQRPVSLQVNQEAFYGTGNWHGVSSMILSE